MRRLQTTNVQTVEFTFEGKTYQAYEGDSIAAALLANGITKSKKVYASDKCRGPFCMMGVCYECVVLIDNKSVQGCMNPIKEGMNIQMKEL